MPVDSADGKCQCGITTLKFVVKVHSRCDLSCDHCYMYETADRSWRQQPQVMSAEIAGHGGSGVL